MSHPTSVTVRVPGKVNIGLSLGSRRTDGYHDIATIFQTVELFDQVTVAAAAELSVTCDGPEATLVPQDMENLAGSAVDLLARRLKRKPDVSIHLHKNIPVAGGMAGGSADAAATLVACNELWGARLGLPDLAAIAIQLGSDVPFLLLGGTAVGEGRGERLTPIPSHTQLHWVFALSADGMSTGQVYAEACRMYGEGHRSPLLPKKLVTAVKEGDVVTIARLIHNDLQPPALRLRPDLNELMKHGMEKGALAAVLAGTGATCAFLCSDAMAGQRLATGLRHWENCRTAVYAAGPAGAPELLDKAR